MPAKPKGRYFEFVGKGSRKFWSVTTEGKSLTVGFGRIGTAGRQKTKSFADGAAAVRAAGALIGEKLAKGYKEATGGPAPGPAKAPTTTKGARKSRMSVRLHPRERGRRPTGLSNGLEGLRSMVRELEARDDVVLLNWDVGKPASSNVLASVEKHLGYPLPSPIREVYRQADGLSLRWIHRDNPVFDAKKHRRVQGRLVPGFVSKTRLPDGLSVIANDGADDGCICLLPVREAFIDASWSYMLYFDWMTDEKKINRHEKSYGLLSFSRSLRILDFFSFYEMAAVLTLEKSLPVIVGTDHGAHWTGPAVDFQSYWEFVLAHYGSVQARTEAFVRPTAKEGAAPASSRLPTLDDVFAICRRAWAQPS